jgi:hypothetical protein
MTGVVLVTRVGEVNLLRALYSEILNGRNTMQGWEYVKMNLSDMSYEGLDWMQSSRSKIPLTALCERD